MCVAVLAMGTLLVAPVGCDIGRAVVADQLRQVDKVLRDATVLARARDQLASAQNKQREIADKATGYRVEANTLGRRIERLERARAESRKAFETVQGSVKQAGLPKLAEATDEDKMRRILVAGSTMSGHEAYRLLEKFKQEVIDTTTAIDEAKDDIAAVLEMANEADQLHRAITREISETQMDIRKLERLQDRRANVESIDKLRLTQEEISTALNMGNVRKELQDEIDKTKGWLDTHRPGGTGRGVGGPAVDSEEIKRRITNPLPSITDDDWV